MKARPSERNAPMQNTCPFIPRIPTAKKENTSLNLVPRLLAIVGIVVPSIVLSACTQGTTANASPENSPAQGEIAKSDGASDAAPNSEPDSEIAGHDALPDPAISEDSSGREYVDRDYNPNLPPEGERTLDPSAYYDPPTVDAKPPKAFTLNRSTPDLPNVPLVTHEGKEVRFYDDLVKGKIVVINFMYATCKDT